jgi:hypothetical protein
MWAKGPILIRGTQMSGSAMSVELAELHCPESGRLDARRIAEYLNVPLTQVARALGVKYQTLYKTPDGPAVQPSLFAIKRVLDILVRVIGERATILAWLNTPHPDLGGRTALAMILEGYADAVAELLEDAMAGMLT